MSKPRGWTKAEAIKRRRTIADTIAQGYTIPEAMKLHNAGRQLVRDSCLEHGVRPTRHGRTGPKAFFVLAAILRCPEANDAEISSVTKATRQYVHEVRGLAVDAGIIKEKQP
jgi:hypothetical protein